MAMALNLFEILQKVLNESVGSNEVKDAILNHRYVDITYEDEDINAPGHRLIQPYAYGITCAGNEAVRAFQVNGDTLRGEPKWKLFLLKRITSWRARKQVFTIPPKEQGYDAPDFNRNGDRTLCKVLLVANFDETGDTLDTLRKRREGLKSAPKMSVNATKGPIPNASQQWKKNVFKSQPNSKKYAQYAKNIEDTENDFNRVSDEAWAQAEADMKKWKDAQEKQNNDAMIQSSAMKPQQTQQGPIARPKNNDKDKKDEE